MKESINTNNKQKIIQAFKILKQTYPQVKLDYSSTNKYYWHLARINNVVLYTHVITQLIKSDISFAVSASGKTVSILL